MSQVVPLTRQYVMLESAVSFALTVGRDSVTLGPGRYQLATKGLRDVLVDDGVSIQSTNVSLSFLANVDGLPVNIVKAVAVKSAYLGSINVASSLTDGDLFNALSPYVPTAGDYVLLDGWVGDGTNGWAWVGANRLDATNIQIQRIGAPWSQVASGGAGVLGKRYTAKVKA